MKTLLTLSVLFLAINFCKAQTPKWILCSVYSNGSKSLLVSEVADVTLLPKTGVNRIGAYGKLNLIDFYSKVAKKWFEDLLRSNGYTGLSQEINVVIKSPDINNINCASGNENGCFISKDDIQEIRKETINLNAPQRQIIYIK